MPNHIADIDASVRATKERDSIPGLALTVTHAGRTILDSAHGMASLELSVPAAPTTVFPLASVTKVFTATLIMQLVEAGKIALDDTLGTLLTGLPHAWAPVTVRQMLAHTSGLPIVIVDPNLGKWLGTNRDDALTQAAALPLQFEPGTGWSYNQTNFVLLGWLLEREWGAPIESLVADRILRPLSLSATVYGDATDAPGGSTDTGPIGERGVRDRGPHHRCRNRARHGPVLTRGVGVAPLRPRFRDPLQPQHSRSHPARCAAKAQAPDFQGSSPSLVSSPDSLCARYIITNHGVITRAAYPGPDLCGGIGVDE